MPTTGSRRKAIRAAGGALEEAVCADAIPVAMCDDLDVAFGPTMQEDQSQPFATQSVAGAVHSDSTMSFQFEKVFADMTKFADPAGKGFPAMRWQIQLFEEWRANRLRSVAVPSCLGTVWVIAIWLLALARQAAEVGAAASLPRRLVHLVHRGTMFDRATDVAEGIAGWLDRNSDHPVASALASLSSHRGAARKPVAISTLRGAHADSEEWKRDPARPSIIIDTVHRIGSRLLFWGEGDDRTTRSLHAGLLGQDVLFVHQEAHLSPAFGRLMRQVTELQSQRAGVKPLKYVELTAQPPDHGNVLNLSEDERTDPEVVRRLRSSKTLTLYELDDQSKPADKRAAIVEKALSYAAARKTVLVCVSGADDATFIARELLKRARRCQTRLVTTELRGYERDELARSKLFRQFTRAMSVDRTRYLVTAAAPSIGVDVDADVGIFDLCTIDGFVERAERVNREGENHGRGEIALFYDDRDHKTIALLRRLPRKSEGLTDVFDASPEALSALASLPDFTVAATPLPRTRKLEPHLLDTWAMTEPQPRVGPAVSPWVLGISQEPPQTALVWRRLPRFANDAPLELYTEWLASCPIRHAERATLPTDRAEKFLEELGRRLGPFTAKMPIAVINRRNAVVKISLAEYQYNRTSLLSDATVILPTEWGGLSAQGFPDAASARKSVSDVADVLNQRERWDLTRREASWAATSLAQSLVLRASSFEQAVIELECARGLRTVWMYAFEKDFADGDIVSAQLALGPRRAAFPNDREAGAEADVPQLLDTHLALTERSARAIGQALTLDSALVERLALAGSLHDRGKNRPWWQRAAGNFTSESFAKTRARCAAWRRLRGYRHEMGTLLDLLDEGFDDDLVLHLVASHHGRSRPGFEAEAFDNAHDLVINETANLDAQLRFERLQRRYGWWGLAYLEALLKCADVMAAAEDN